MTRSLRRLVARLGVALLLFMQLAVAAHACPVRAADAPGMRQHAMEPMPGCAQSGQSAPSADPLEPAPPDHLSNLCLEHCQQGSQAADNGSTLTPPAMAMLPLFAVPATDDASLQLSPLAAQRELLARATAPPASIRFCVLRS